MGYSISFIEQEECVDPVEIAARKRRIVAAMKSVEPTIQAEEFDYEEMARAHEITIEEARREMEGADIDLIASGEVPGFAATVGDNFVTLGVYDDEDQGPTQRDLKALERYAEAIIQCTGYAVHDTQLDFTAPTFAEVRAHALRNVVPRGAKPAQASAAEWGQIPQAFRVEEEKPWWKFW